jgi:hypothetical protein
MVSLEFNPTINKWPRTKKSLRFAYFISVPSFFAAVQLNAVSLGGWGLSFAYTFGIWLPCAVAYLFTFLIEGSYRAPHKNTSHQAAIIACASVATLYMAFELINLFQKPVPLTEWNNYLFTLAPCIVIAGIFMGLNVRFSAWLLKSIPIIWKKICRFLK